MSGYFNSFSRSWNSTKRYPLTDVSTLFMATLLAIALIYSGVVMMNNEKIFKTLYPDEGFQVPLDLPTGLSLTNTTVKSIRKESKLNLYLSYAMIAGGAGTILFYVIPKLIF
jgi:hypothetical protein